MPKIITKFGDDLCALLETAGITAWIAPGKIKGFWSEKHAGYACGLGSFA